MIAFLWQVEGREKRQASDGFIKGIPGEANVDYPTLASVPDTSFSCANRVEGGYYADVETECQVFHVCGGSRSIFASVKYSFVCPNGTVFHQEYFICDWWYNVDCSLASDFYDLNNDIGDPSNSGNKRPAQSSLTSKDQLPSYGNRDSPKQRPGNKSLRKTKQTKTNGQGKGRKSPVRIQITSDEDAFPFPRFGSQRQKRRNNMDILTEQEQFFLMEEREEREPREYYDDSDDYVHNPIFD